MTSDQSPLAAVSHCMQKASNDNAKKVVKASEDNWNPNKDDCNKFLKAVASACGVHVITGNADQIITFLDGNPTGWTKLSRGDHQEAFDKAKEGRFVVAGLLSSDMSQAHGHVAVVTCGDLVHSTADNIDYPRGYWGKLGGVGEQCMGLNFGFPAPARKTMRYFWKSI